MFCLTYTRYTYTYIMYVYTPVCILYTVKTEWLFSTQSSYPSCRWVHKEWLYNVTYFILVWGREVNLHLATSK